VRFKLVTEGHSDRFLGIVSSLVWRNISSSSFLLAGRQIKSLDYRRTFKSFLVARLLEVRVFVVSDYRFYWL